MKPEQIKDLEVRVGGTVEKWHTETVNGREVVVIDRMTIHNTSAEPDPRRQHKEDKRRQRPK